MQEVGEMSGKRLDCCLRWDGLCARAGHTTRVEGTPKLGFGLRAVWEGVGSRSGRE